MACRTCILSEYLPVKIHLCTEEGGVGGMFAAWLIHSTPDRAVQVQALAGDIVLGSSVRHFTLTVPLSTQVYKWVPANLMLGVTLQWTSIPSRGGVEILLVASCYRNWEKL